jgi:hypothetical protein
MNCAAAAGAWRTVRARTRIHDIGTARKAAALFAVDMVVLSITLAGVFLYAMLEL